MHCEDLLHLFWDCTYARNIWKIVRNDQWQREAESTTFENWIVSNLKDNKQEFRGIPWKTWFAALLWQIWKDRNNKVFANLDGNASHSIFQAFQYASNIHEAFMSPPCH